MTESPYYNVEKKDGNFEIREYGDYILAQVDVEADYRNVLGMEFSILANYIFGGNKKKSKIPMATPVAGVNVSGSERIAMAVPVTEEKAGKEIYRISFAMPSKYTLETLPNPDDGRIKFKEEKNQRMAVMRFSEGPKKNYPLKKK
jgi:hypothetical protein